MPLAAVNRHLVTASVIAWAIAQIVGVRLASQVRFHGKAPLHLGIAHLPHVRSRIPTDSQAPAASVRMASWATSRGLALFLRAIANQRHAMWKTLPRRQDFSANAIRLHFVLM